MHACVPWPHLAHTKFNSEKLGLPGSTNKVTTCDGEAFS